MAAAIKSLLTVGASVAWEALATIPSCQLLHAGATIKARVISACHSNDLTVFAIEALGAGAGVVILQVLHGGNKHLLIILFIVLYWHDTKLE